MTKEAEKSAKSKGGIMNLKNLNLDEFYLAPIAESLETNFADLKERFNDSTVTICSILFPFAKDCKQGILYEREGIFYKDMNFDSLTATIKEERIFHYYLQRGSESFGRIQPEIGINVVFNRYEGTSPSHSLILKVSMEPLENSLRLKINVHDRIDGNKKNLYKKEHEMKYAYAHTWTKNQMDTLLSEPKTAMHENLKNPAGENQ